jgi:hypothetical protein
VEDPVNSHLSSRAYVGAVEDGGTRGTSQRFVMATFSSSSFMVAMTSPSSSLRNTFAPARWSLSRVSGVGWP